MNITVTKRDGRVVAFDSTRITKAIRKAMREVGVNDEQKAYSVSKNVIDALPDQKTYNVEDIQDVVERELMKSDMQDVAKAYIIYRNKRNKARNSSSNEVIDDIVAAKKNDVTRENANMNADTPAGMMMKIASERSKEYVDDVLLSSDVRKAVDDNILHVHDKDYYPSRSLVCLQHPIDKLLANGFSAGHGESRPAKRIETASIIAAISMETIQNEMMGGQAIPAFDFYMAPYVRQTYSEELEKIEKLTMDDLTELKNAPVDEYEEKPTDNILSHVDCVKQHAINMTIERVHQSMEAFVHNMNMIHSRGGRAA